MPRTAITGSGADPQDKDTGRDEAPAIIGPGPLKENGDLGSHKPRASAVSAKDAASGHRRPEPVHSRLDHGPMEQIKSAG